MYRNKRGFTLLEVLAVLVITAIMIGIAGYTFANQRQNGKLNTAVAAFGQDLRYIRSKALTNSRPFRLNQTANNEYRIEEFVNNGWRTVSTKHLPGNVSFVGSFGQITFDTRGFASFTAQNTEIVFTFNNHGSSQRMGIYPSMTGSYLVVDEEG